MNNNSDKFMKVSYELLDMIDETKEEPIEITVRPVVNTCAR